jgi:hypothetical protein
MYRYLSDSGRSHHGSGCLRDFSIRREARLVLILDPTQITMTAINTTAKKATI